MPKKKPTPWFIKVRGSYLPNNLAGALTYIPFMAFLAFVPVYIFQNTSSVVYAAIISFPSWVAAGVVMTWLAKLKS